MRAAHGAQPFAAKKQQLFGHPSDTGYKQEARTARGRELCFADCRTWKATGRPEENTRCALSRESLAQQQEHPTSPTPWASGAPRCDHTQISPTQSRDSLQITEVRTRGRVSHLAGATEATFQCSHTQETHRRGGLGAEAMSVSYSSLQLLLLSMHLIVNARGEVT